MKSNDLVGMRKISSQRYQENTLTDNHQNTEEEGDRETYGVKELVQQ